MHCVNCVVQGFMYNMRELNKEVWPYKVMLDKPDSVTEIEVWLGAQLGTFRGRWHVVYQHNKTYFYFKEGKDATMFALKWL